jgi:hypothetical protein
MEIDYNPMLRDGVTGDWYDQQYSELTITKLFAGLERSYLTKALFTKLGSPMTVLQPQLLQQISRRKYRKVFKASRPDIMIAKYGIHIVAKNNTLFYTITLFAQ